MKILSCLLTITVAFNLHNNISTEFLKGFSLLLSEMKSIYIVMIISNIIKVMNVDTKKRKKISLQERIFIKEIYILKILKM